MLVGTGSIKLGPASLRVLRLLLEASLYFFYALLIQHSAEHTWFRRCLWCTHSISHSTRRLSLFDVDHPDMTAAESSAFTVQLPRIIAAAESTRLNVKQNHAEWIRKLFNFYCWVCSHCEFWIVPQSLLCKWPAFIIPHLLIISRHCSVIVCW